MRKFLKDLFMMPDSNGYRRLVKNKLTGRTVWTRGVVPVFVNHIEQELNKEDGLRTKTVMIEPHEAFEPLRNSRFKVNFDEIKPLLIDSYQYQGKKMTDRDGKVICTSKISIMLPLIPEMSIENRLLSMVGKKIGDVTLEILDPTGVVVRVVKMSNVKVVEVELLENFSFSQIEHIERAIVIFDHDERVIEDFKK